MQKIIAVIGNPYDNEIVHLFSSNDALKLWMSKEDLFFHQNPIK
jgi:hypothetical protein